MHVLHVTHQYRPAIGGAEQHITSISEELAQRGHHVSVATSRSRDYMTWRNELPPFEELAGVQVRRFWSPVRGEKTLRMLDYGYRHYWHGRSRRYEPLILLGNGPICPGIVWHVLRHGSAYDLIHINHLHYAHSALAFWAARQRHIPIVVTPHLHIEQPLTYDVRYLQAILVGSQHVLADTEAERQFLLGVGFDPRRVTTAGTGICLERFPILDRRTCRDKLGVPDQAYVLLFLGRKTEYKGLDLVLQVFASLQPQIANLYLIILGPDTDYSRRLLTQYADLPRLMNHGSVADDVRLAALNACDCLVMPSTGEAFGIVFIEAWAVGKPVIAAHTNAVASVVSDGIDGYLIAPGNADQLAERVARLVENRSIGQQMGRRGQKKVLNRYTVPRVTDIVEGVYFRVLRRQGQRTASGANTGTRPTERKTFESRSEQG